MERERERQKRDTLFPIPQPRVELIMFVAMTSAPVQAFATHLISEDKAGAHIIYHEFNKDSCRNVNLGDCKWYLKVAVLLAGNKNESGNVRGILVRDFYYLSSDAARRSIPTAKPQIMNCRKTVAR